jgi:hypothetical protein
LKYEKSKDADHQAQADQEEEEDNEVLQGARKDQVHHRQQGEEAQEGEVWFQGV